MNYKDKVSDLYNHLSKFSSDISYTKEKEFFILECKDVNVNNRLITLKIKANYDQFLYENTWSYSPDNVNYITRKGDFSTIDNILENCMFNQEYLLSCKEVDLERIDESINYQDTKMLRVVNDLNLSYWKVDENNNTLFFVNKPEKYFDMQFLKQLDGLKMFEMKNFINHDQAYHEFTRIREVIKNLQ